MFLSASATVSGRRPAVKLLMDQNCAGWRSASWIPAASCASRPRPGGWRRDGEWRQRPEGGPVVPGCRHSQGSRSSPSGFGWSGAEDNAVGSGPVAYHPRLKDLDAVDDLTPAEPIRFCGRREDACLVVDVLLPACLAADDGASWKDRGGSLGGCHGGGRREGPGMPVQAAAGRRLQR